MAKNLIVTATLTLAMVVGSLAGCGKFYHRVRSERKVRQVRQAGVPESTVRSFAAEKALSDRLDGKLSVASMD